MKLFKNFIFNIKQQTFKFKDINPTKDIENRKRAFLNGVYYIQSTFSKKYLKAEEKGSSPCVANASVPGEWEMFSFAERENGMVAIKALCNGKFANLLDSSLQIIATHDHPEGRHQTFEICFSFFDLDIVSFKSCSNNRYMCVLDEVNHPVVFWGEKISHHSIFCIRKHDSD